jgi:hypothetical protein
MPLNKPQTSSSLNISDQYWQFPVQFSPPMPLAYPTPLVNLDVSSWNSLLGEEHKHSTVHKNFYNSSSLPIQNSVFK